MRKIKDILKIRPIVHFILILSWCVQLCIGQPSKDTFIELRTRLTQQIDSLDIEKQLKKRIGENISEIEGHQSVLLDSLKMLRTTFQNDLTSSNNLPTPHKKFSINSITNYIPTIFTLTISKLKPGSTFDWFILITSGVAFISISILFIVIVASFKRSSRSKKTIPLPTPSKKMPAQNKQTVANENTARENQAITLLDDLKKKIQMDKIDNESPTLWTTSRELKTAPYESTPPAANDLESLVLQAYQNGSEISEISKRFHISSDHVSLIIKVKTT
jgi:hypothetical protein